MIELIKDVSGLVPKELKQVKKLYGKLWEFVKEDGELLTLPDEIKAAAVQLAAEAIQVSAMAEKLKDSRAEREGGEIL